MSDPSEPVSEDTTEKSEMSAKEVEQAEEAKWKEKFPLAPNKPISGHSAFLQKRLAKGQKFFDSGDYNMARQKQPPKSAIPVVPNYNTGGAIPTPETVPARKTSIIQPKFPSTAT